MASVTARINQVQQPRGGYINPKDFRVTVLDSNASLYDISKENVHASLVGLAVDYLTRFMLTKDVSKAFKISAFGARILGKDKLFDSLINNVKGLDDESIKSTLKIVGFDVAFRAGPERYKPIEEINPNDETIQNVRLMVERSLEFFKTYGPTVLDGFTFSGGYTATVDSGDGDFTTKDTLWDFKVSISEPTNKHTLQLLMYYIMGKHSTHKEFESITKIGIFNPRLGKIYIYDMEHINPDIITDVEDNVIVYPKEVKKDNKKSGSTISSSIIKTNTPRNSELAESILIKEFGSSEKIDIKKTINDANNNSIDALCLLIHLYSSLAVDSDIEYDYKTKTILYLEAVISAEKVLWIDEEEGTFQLAKVLFHPPIFRLSNGRLDDEVNVQIHMTSVLYALRGWDEFGIIECGAFLAFKYTLEDSPSYDPKKAKTILLELQKEDTKDLPSTYFIVMGSEYIKGQMFGYDYQKAKQMFQILYDRGNENAFLTMEKIMKHYGRKEPSQQPQTSQTNNKEKKGCYVATCVYGSYDCPQVWVLRRYRDYYLDTKWWGRLFIKVYYAISPKIVSLFGKTLLFNKINKAVLDKKIDKLYKKGYEDNPYNDKY